MVSTAWLKTVDPVESQPQCRDAANDLTSKNVNVEKLSDEIGDHRGDEELRAAAKHFGELGLRGNRSTNRRG